MLFTMMLFQSGEAALVVVAELGGEQGDLARCNLQEVVALLMAVNNRLTMVAMGMNVSEIGAFSLWADLALKGCG